ncbi:hypothetical protein AB0G02_32000 [Actinosynnema sp. NPDC023658]|uniref:hypothetical protein n=1 Tax=Actinosynnema sp. NPDC023658 TaxID=3155465 RepID=UPI0033EAEF0C
MEPKKNKTATTRKRTTTKKKPDKGKQSVDVKLSKRKRKKDDVAQVNVTEDLRIVRRSWMKEDRERWTAESRKADRSMLEKLRGEGGKGEAEEDPSGFEPMPLAIPVSDDPEQRGTQRMVASATDLMDIKALQEFRPDVYGKLTVNQVWALVAAERKGLLQHEKDLRLSEARLEKLNAQFKTTYEPEDLPVILKALRARRLASNFFFSVPPGRNIGVDTNADSLLDLLMADDEGRFRNVWETGTSQASVDPGPRGGAEERFGYAAALKRTEGTPLSIFGGKFATEPTPVPFDEDDTSPEAVERRRLQKEYPNYVQPRELPKYAAAVGPSQVYGVSARYGSSVIYWKQDIDWRTTRSPGDSWSNDMFQSGMAFVSANYPESIFAYTDPYIARVAAAEATSFKRDPELGAKVEKQGGVDVYNYIEAQIHGDLSWRDVDVIVLNYGKYGGISGAIEVTLADAKRDAAKLTRFAEENGYGFTVHIGREYDGGIV